jgi:predicted RNA-binding Zn-ribbon protein involved in translation (DUF1610 family)
MLAAMENLVFRCARTGANVQVWLTQAPTPDDEHSYEAVPCPACGRTHLVNKQTGRILGDREGLKCHLQMS